MGTISRAVVWIDGQFLNAADLNGEFNIIHDEFNGNIDDSNIKTAAAIAGTKISPDFGQQSVVLQELAADPGALANKGRLYTKDVSGGTELFFRDAAGNVIQITASGVLSSAIIILPGYIHGCGISNNAISPASKVDVAVGALEVETAAGADPEVIEVASTLEMDFSGTGADGLDTGSPAINWYHMYVIYDPTGPTVASLSSLSATSPTLPGGYTKFRRIGTFYNTASGSASIRAFEQFGKGSMRRYQHTGSAYGVSVLSGGGATSPTSVSLSTAVPATADVVYGSAATPAGHPLLIALSGNSSNELLKIGMENAAGGLNIDGHRGAAPFSLIMETAQTIYYKVENASRPADLNVFGYEESI